jgi:hypothetical protein
VTFKVKMLIDEAKDKVETPSDRIYLDNRE